jgi:arsenite oxidase small subunit
MNRRDFLKRSGGIAGAATIPVTTTAAAAGAAGGSAAPPGEAYPVVDVARLSDLAPGSSIGFSYPDAASPALLVRLDGPAADGVGDDASVVAFSSLCTHKGCRVSYKAEQGVLICPCHWSTFDPAKGGRLVIGQASDALPRIHLRVTEGTVQAVGMDGLIYGRHTNIL